MADIGSNTGGAADIVEAQRRDQRIALQEQGKRLANSSASTENGDLGLACGGGREAAGLGEGAESCAREHGSDEHESDDDDDERERTKEEVVVVESKDLSLTRERTAVVLYPLGAARGPARPHCTGPRRRTQRARNEGQRARG